MNKKLPMLTILSLLLLSSYTYADVDCKGNACKNIKHRFVEVQGDDFKYEVTNNRSDDIDVKIHWGKLLDCNSYNRIVLYSGETQRVKNPINVKAVCYIISNKR